MSQTLSLYRLQQVDSQIDRAHTRLQAIQEILDDDAELLSSKEGFDSANVLFQSTAMNLKQAEEEAQNQRIKIEQTEASLYGSQGHSPKELLDLQNDVAALKRHMIKLEDIQLEAMMNVEKSQSLFQAAQEELLAAQIKSEARNRGLKEEQTGLQKELEKLYSERAATAGPIPQDTVTMYDKLRQQRRGLAVAVISENSCSACGSGLSAAQMQSSRASSNMAFCPSCGRILYGN
jgi:uncharacterized protein